MYDIHLRNIRFIMQFCYIFMYSYFSYLPDMNWVSRIEVILDRLVDKINQIAVLADQHRYK